MPYTKEDMREMSKEDPKRHRRLSRMGGITAQKNRREKKERRKQKLLNEMYANFVQRNEHICPVD